MPVVLQACPYCRKWTSCQLLLRDQRSPQGRWLCHVCHRTHPFDDYEVAALFVLVVMLLVELLIRFAVGLIR